MTNQTITVETITPEEAATMMSTNTHNRSLRKSLFMSYASDMKNFKWEMNGEAIKFDTNGRLLDGQHRLQACIEAGTPFDSVVIRGVAASIMNIDTGAPRSFGDYLKLDRGVAEANQVAAAVRGTHDFQITGGRLHKTYVKPSIAQLAQWFDDHAESHIETAASIRRLKQSTGMRIHSRSLADVVFAATANGVVEPLREFIDTLESGGARDDAANVLRDYIIKASMASSRSKPTAVYMRALTIKAWNKWISGETVQQLRVDRKNLTSPVPIFDVDGTVLFPFNWSDAE